VFQSYALFPHMTVAQNIGFGLEMLGKPKSEVRETVGAMLKLVRMEELRDRRTDQISGGQQQRVALARALAPRPGVLLLDEPFSSLDTHLRADVRSEVALLLRELGITAVFVTHDQDEAFVLGDEVAVMREGRVVQQAAPAELYRHPADPWLAAFVGDADLVPGRADGEVAATALGPVPLVDAAHGAVRVLLRPEELCLTAGDDGVVTEVSYFGHDALSVVRLLDGTEVRSRATGVPAFGVGDRVTVVHRGGPVVAYAGDA
jgi:ABC-type Fe3+/spermidine/putrescine transport system ATPase subunit